MNSQIANKGTTAAANPAHCCRSLYCYYFGEHQGVDESFASDGLVPGFQVGSQPYCCVCKVV